MTTDVAVITHGDSIYKVKRISAEPPMYVAFVETFPLPQEHLHRDGRSMLDALRAITAHIENIERTMAAMNTMLRPYLKLVQS